MSHNNNVKNGETIAENPASVIEKGMSLEKLMSKFGTKLTQERGKAFEQKFAAKYKEYDNAMAIVAGIQKELEKLFVEFTENL
jgi:hypothetical protein